MDKTVINLNKQKSVYLIERTKFLAENIEIVPISYLVFEEIYFKIIVAIILIHTVQFQNVKFVVDDLDVS